MYGSCISIAKSSSSAFIYLAKRSIGLALPFFSAGFSFLVLHLSRLVDLDDETVEHVDESECRFINLEKIQIY